MKNSESLNIFFFWEEIYVNTLWNGKREEIECIQLPLFPEMHYWIGKLAFNSVYLNIFIVYKEIIMKKPLQYYFPNDTHRNKYSQNTVKKF